MVVPVLPGGDRDPGGGVPGELVAAAADGGGGVPAAPAASALPQHQSRAEAHRVYRSVYHHLFKNHHLKTSKTLHLPIAPSLSRTFGPKKDTRPVFTLGAFRKTDASFSSLQVLYRSPCPLYLSPLSGADAIMCLLSLAPSSY